jgi:hypothetical protein
MHRTDPSARIDCVRLSLACFSCVDRQNRLSEALEPHLQEMCERIAKFEPRFRANLSRRLRAAGATKQEVEEQFQLLNRGEFKVRPVSRSRARACA